MIIGITGSIATGKSTVSQYIQQQGYTVIDADLVAKQLLAPNSPFLAKVITLFGDKILQTNGELDRQQLAEIIFNDEVSRHQLNQIMHPEILKTMQMQSQIAIANGKSIIFWDVPLLFESQFDQYVDKTIVVYTPPKIQLERLMRRNTINEKQAQSMLDSQWSIDDKINFADIKIDNSGHLLQTYQQIEQYLTIISNSR